MIPNAETNVFQIPTLWLSSRNTSNKWLTFISDITMSETIVMRDLIELSLEDNKKLRKEFFNKTYHSLKNMENVDTIKIIAKSAMSETIVINDLLDELREFWQLLRHKLPHLISGVDTKKHRRPLLARDMNDITNGHTFTAGNHMMATDAIKTTSDIIEPNVESIDLILNESVKQNTYPIVSANKTQTMAEPRGDSREELETVSQDQPIRPKTPPMLSLFRRVLNDQTGELESITTADAEIIVAEPDIAFILMNGAQSVDPIVSDSGDEHYNHGLATDYDDDIEPNLVIDLNDTQSVDQSDDLNVFALRRRAATDVTNTYQTSHVQVIDIKNLTTDTATLDGIKCPDCGKDFTNKYVMRSHYKYQHSPVGRQRVYACHWPGCDIKTKRKSNLKVHQLVHSEDRPYPCEWPGCDFKAKFKSKLNRHQLVHSSDRLYACEWPGCDYRGKRKDVVQKHKRKHSIDKACA
ncbi:unnamed protein product [Medioppia subpectinata]|uniref:C2H2-type domain-containing protein n=1 Tax=Medioppia subpectinata TaxID=1979941 RepID=A0A7R9Q190_9ACAR|nr:unnamed protein product [Medioppia subpectinata]CAG2108834.1 unnamed protein product [Medioppia subpectinata]